jgi:hypothetical protein
MTVGTWIAASPVAASARAPVLRAYEGTTSAGDLIRIFTTARDGAVRFQAVGLEGAAACDDGTSPSFSHGFDLGLPGIRLVEGRVDVENLAFSEAFFLSGTLGARAGSGTLTHLYAALDAAEAPQLCTTGELAWTVARVPAPAAAEHSSPAVVASADGGTTVTWDLAPARARPSRQVGAERLRSYEGRTSAGAPLFVATSKRPEGVVMHELGVAWELACDDATSLGLGLFILFAGEPLDPGRLDYDAAAPDIAIHVNGRLGPHAGSGTTSGTVPALTPDLEAQACSSGDLTWRAWRIDPGARPD